MKSLVELGKSILKVCLLMGTATYVIYLYLPTIIRISDGNLNSALETLKKLFPLLLIASLIALATIAAIDYFWQRYQHIESLKMTRQEQKDEFKQTEGSPEVKQKIRQSKWKQVWHQLHKGNLLRMYQKLTAIITNPTHFAVALKYIVGEPGAPEVVAMGRGNVAQEIISRAKKKILQCIEVHY